MPGLPPLPRAWGQPLGGQCRRGDHRAVEQHRGAPHRGLRTETGHRRQIGATADAQQRNGIGRQAPGPVQRITNRRGLAGPARIVDAGTAADHFHGFGVGQCGHQRGRRGGVADTHVPGDQQIGAGVDFLVGDPASRLDRTDHLIRGQGVLDGDVAARPPDLVSADLVGQRLRSVDGDVDDAHAGARHIGEHVHRGATGDEVRHHPRRDLGRIGRHPGRGHAMVTGEDHHPGPLELLRRTLRLACRHPDRQLFEAPQRTCRFGQGRLARPRRRGGVRIGVRDRREVAHRQVSRRWRRVRPAGEVRAYGAAATRGWRHRTRASSRSRCCPGTSRPPSGSPCDPARSRRSP